MIKIKCKKEKEFKILDNLLAEQEYKEKPEIDEIEVEYNKNKYYYTLHNEFDKWYIVTE